MSATLLAGLGLALGSAAALNWGYFAQHRAVGGLPRLTLRHPLRSLVLLFRERSWLVGFLVGIGGWVLYVAALALAPLSLVQATSAGGIGILALLAWQATGVRLTSWELAGVGAAVTGLVLLGVSLAGQHGAGRQPAWQPVALWLACSAAAAAGAAALGGRRALARGAGLGAAAGLLYAAGDVGTKAAVAGGGRLAFIPALLACHGLAFVALQLGFQRGTALATAGVATLLTNALPIAAGTALFHEGLPDGALGALRVLAFASVVAGAAGLARSEPGAAPSSSDVALERAA
jgi:hypothetical protein